jgi:hypothetical protein
MPTRKDGLRPGEVARAKRVARMIANVVEPRRVVAVRSVIARLRQQQLRPRDLDSPNGEAAIAAIVSTMTQVELHTTTPAMGKIWELIASRAVQYSGSGAYR